jgi:hypothetical protein
MKTRKIVKTIFPVIGIGVASGVGQSVIGNTVSGNVARTATQSVLGTAGVFAGLGAISNLTKGFDKGSKKRRR